MQTTDHWQVNKRNEWPAKVGGHGLVVAQVYTVVGLFPTELSGSGEKKHKFLN